MSMTRRLFSGWLGAAPLAAAVTRPGMGTIGNIDRSAKPLGFAGMSTDEASRYIPTPEPTGLKDYYAASQKFHDGKRYINLLADARQATSRGAVNANVMALRSVSDQHKQHMLVDRLLKGQEEDCTFSQKLLDTFNVRSWFEEQDSHGSVQVNSAGYGASGF